MSPAAHPDDPDHADRLAQAARAFAGARLDEAAALCRAVLAQAPDQPHAQRQLGLIHVVRHELAAARALLEPLLPRFADDADFRLALAERSEEHTSELQSRQ